MPIIQQFNHKFEPVFTTKARYIHIWGGRGRGGSHFATDYFLHRITTPDYFRGYFMREIFSDIRQSLWQDFNDRLTGNDTVNEKLFSIQDVSMTAEYSDTRNTITSRGFKKASGKQTAKLKSIAGATHIVIEEAEEISEADFNQLDDSLRTTKGNLQIIMVFNPPNKDHWIMKRWYNLFDAKDIYGSEYKDYYVAKPKEDPLLLSIHSTYLDNFDNVHPTTRQNFENYKATNFEYYCTMIKGLVSEGMKGVIFKNWKPITAAEYYDLPYDEFYGQDFGFSEDPAAMAGVKVHNDKIFIREIFYETKLTNPDISDKYTINGIAPDARIYADCAEPKSIEELKRMGWNIVDSLKGQDSVRAGINYLKSKEVYYVETSSNLIYEKNNYRWALDADKNPTDKPVDKFNHLMDAIRYATYTEAMKPQWDVIMA